MNSGLSKSQRGWRRWPRRGLRCREGRRVSCLRGWGLEEARKRSAELLEGCKQRKQQSKYLSTKSLIKLVLIANQTLTRRLLTQPCLKCMLLHKFKRFNQYLLKRPQTSKNRLNLQIKKTPSQPYNPSSETRRLSNFASCKKWMSQTLNFLPLTQDPSPKKKMSLAQWWGIKYPDSKLS